jgi:hypothetical protein
VRDGIQQTGLRPRQRWRCTAPNGTYHRFLGALSITRVVGGICPICERPFGPAEGPAVPAWHEYLVQEIATALVALGGGATYADVAERLRGQAWGAQRQWNRKPSTNVNGGNVAEWLGQYGPTVAAAHAETEWPDTLVLDSTEFHHTDSHTGVQSQLFCVLFAYGYPTDGTKPRMWKIASSPSDTGQHWADFLSLLPGKPRVVVCDDDSNIKLGIRTHWYQGRGVHIHSCEHHLYLRALKAMEKDQVPKKSPLHDALNKAFRSVADWDELRDLVRVTGSPALQKWMKSKNQMITTQAAKRHEISVFANGAIEAPIRTIRQNIEKRAWCFRNRARMDLLLEMMRLRLNKVDSVEGYARLIRTDVAGGGVAQGSRRQWDPKGVASLRR